MEMIIYFYSKLKKPINFKGNFTISNRNTIFHSHFVSSPDFDASVVTGTRGTDVRNRQTTAAATRVNIAENATTTSTTTLASVSQGLLVSGREQMILLNLVEQYLLFDEIFVY